MKKRYIEVRACYTPCDTAEDFSFGNVSSRYSATRRYVIRDGVPVTVTAGEFHFSRYDCRFWEREILKMKAQGLDCISTYVFWNHHERRPGKFDFGGNNDINRFVSLCKRHGLKVILRIGPWCHGEVRRGGFPDYLAFVPGKRKSTPLYMHFVKRFWTALAERVKEFCDGETIFAVQLENEYTGNISHIAKLREAAETAGFKTPFFTMTAWPADNPDKRFLPMFGGYPEAPWTQTKKPLPPQGRFAVTAGRSEVAIGDDLSGKKSSSADFSGFPYATCETGTGNQVSHHRRPVISENDGYGIAFAKLASGAVWQGYYMYHGGRNPSDRPMQESRRTFYPNDYPVADYDFQAPVSKDGKVRGHADRLRLLHYFLRQNGQSFARTQTFFADDRNMPYFSYRADENGGYVFVSDYERGATLENYSLDIDIDADGYKVKIDDLRVNAGDMFFMPVRQSYGGIMFDYITAQPVAVLEEGGRTHAYFVRFANEVRMAAANGITTVTEAERVFKNEEGELIMHFLDPAAAKKLYILGGKAIFSEYPLFEQDGKIFAEKTENAPKNAIVITKTAKKRMPFSTFMPANGKKVFYNIKIDNGLLDNAEDAEIDLRVKGLDFQLFKEKKLVDDGFNTDGHFVFRLKRIASKDGFTDLTFKICAAASKGKGRVYNEIGIKPGEAEITDYSLKYVIKEEVRYE